jgi:hypothetical protein
MRFGLIGPNPRILSRVGRHLVNNYYFTNYMNWNNEFKEYIPYIYSNVNTYEKYEKLKGLNFKFIKIIDNNYDKFPFMKVEYIINSDYGLKMIIENVEYIVEKEKLNQLHGIYI